MKKNEKLRENQFTITKLNKQHQQNTRINTCLERDLEETKKNFEKNEQNHKIEIEKMQIKNDNIANKHKKLQKKFKKNDNQKNNELYY